MSFVGLYQALVFEPWSSSPLIEIPNNFFFFFFLSQILKGKIKPEKNPKKALGELNSKEKKKIFFFQTRKQQNLTAVGQSQFPAFLTNFSFNFFESAQK